MSKSLLVSLLTLAAVIILVLLLGHQNDLASNENPSLDYPSFNHGDIKEAQKIMTFWRKEDMRVDAVKTMVVLDYVLIAIYVAYLWYALIYRKKIEKQRLPAPRSWLVFWLGAGVVFILLGAVIDVIQDSRIYSYVSSGGPVSDFQWLTTLKFGLLMLGVAPLLISLVTKYKIDYLSSLLKTIWTFFPSILFIFLTIFCFWIQGQGKDIMIAFTEGTSRFNGKLIIFFLAIGFWVYVSWYSSRVIAYIKDKNGHNLIKGDFLENYPRLVGNACFLVLELAVLQSPLLRHPLSSAVAWVIFILALLGFHFIDKWIRTRINIGTEVMANRFWIVFAVFLALLVIVGLSPFSRSWYTLLVFLLIFHLVYLFYINLHHVDTEAKKGLLTKPRNRFERIMEYFCIPLFERGYFRWLILTSIVAIAIDLVAIFHLEFARDLGPFPLLILAFAILLAFGNVVTAFSVRYSVNFHLILFGIAFCFGLKETHKVTTRDLKEGENGYAHRPSLDTYLRAWLRRLPSDTTRRYDTYFVLANGGASRSGYWTASVLGRLEDSSLGNPDGKFSDHVFCLSGTSGGGVGVATFFALLNDKRKSQERLYQESAALFLEQDYFSYTAARMLGPDYFNYIFHILGKDRAAALEQEFEDYSDGGRNLLYKPNFGENFSWFKTLAPDGTAALPVLFVNTTRMQDGNPGLVTNLKLDSNFNQRVDVLGLLDPTTDISMASGAILGARFPYLSPAGRIGTNYFVDGGYFDNSGAGAVQELMRAILNLRRGDAELAQKIQRLNFKVLHVLNSPIIQDSADQKPVAPIKNDLFAPLATIVGAYGMQTTVNDGRLKNYIADLDSSVIPASYTRISLYKDSAEWVKDSLYLNKIAKKEPAYSMNWFMSGMTRNRIKERLDSQPAVKELIGELRIPK
jgi:hypothetical protein